MGVMSTATTARASSIWSFGAFSRTALSALTAPEAAPAWRTVVLPCLASYTVSLAPALVSTFATSAASFATAMKRADTPSLSRASTSAPASSKRRATDSLALKAAQKSGVPTFARTLILSLRPNSFSTKETISSLLELAASCNRVGFEASSSFDSGSSALNRPKASASLNKRAEVSRRPTRTANRRQSSPLTSSAEIAVFLPSSLSHDNIALHTST
mmetsp:Transcript_10530/g.18616  ORF Transcript_10530/g.18616 Transcript_10530/m.18616 type:complete len:216 (-) Transcript_10530:365-1012(-)